MAKTTSYSKLHKQANDYKKIYETELHRLANKSLQTVKKTKNGKSTQTNINRGNASNDEAGFDSDETIEMTEEEIDMAYKLTTC